MIGVGQTNRILHFISVITGMGAVEDTNKRTSGSRCFSNPFGKGNPDAAPYIFITKKHTIKFGHTLTGASELSENRMNEIMKTHGGSAPA